jgi:hypothetical protein
MWVMRVLMTVCGAIGVDVLLSVVVLMLMVVRMGMLVFVIVDVGMSVLVMVSVYVFRAGKDVDLGSGEAAADDLVLFEPGTDIEQCRGVLQDGKRHTSIDKGAQEHVAADAGEAFEISNSHRENCKRPGLSSYAPRRKRTSAGSTALREPERKPVQSSVTYLKPALRSSAAIVSIMSMLRARVISAREISSRAISPW